MVRRVLAAVAVLVVSAWTLHTLVLAANTLLAQHPTTMLQSSPTQNRQHPPGGYRQAIVAANDMLPAKAYVAVVNRTGFRETYAYYWASYKLYPRHLSMAESTEAAAEGLPDYILDIRDSQQPVAVQPQGYLTVSTSELSGGTVMVVLTRA